MKLHLYILLLGLLIGPLMPQTQAQAFFDYQTIGKHTWFFTVAWNGQKPQLGFGYNYRLGDAFVSDLLAEWRFDIDGMYRTANHQFIAGYFKNVRAQRLHGAFGIHGKITRSTIENQARSLYSLQATYLPSYSFAASLTDGLYSSIALRASYEAILFGKSWNADAPESATTHALPAHQIQVGGNLSAHLERTFCLNVNGLMQKKFSNKTDLFSSEDLEWTPVGNLHVGSTYALNRAR